jgi:hypothetical protein
MSEPEQEAEQHAQQTAEQSAKRVIGRPFQKGASGNPGGKPKAVVASDESGGAIPQQLADMRHVYSRPDSEDRTQGQRVMRGWLKDNPSVFLAAKTRLEEKLLEAGAVKAAKNETSLNSAVEPDAGTQRCVEMYERLLKEWGEELR